MKSTIAELAKDASSQITTALAGVADQNELVLDLAIAKGIDVTDSLVVWSERRPLGAVRLHDCGGVLALLEGPERGPTPEERKIFAANLTRGDRLSSLSRPTQWVVSSSRGKNVIAWLVEQPRGAEEDPDSPVHGDADGWAVWDMTTKAHLRREGRALRHCVGSDSAGYSDAVESGKCKIFSVRENGKPRCTVEVRGGKVVSTQGASGMRLSEIALANAAWLSFDSRS